MKIDRNQRGRKGSLSGPLVVILLSTSAILFATSFRAAPVTVSRPIDTLDTAPTATPSPTPTPPTLIVTTTADSGPGSLRQALAAANDGDTIQFDPALNGQTITLTTAELFINKSITINGPGSNLLTIMRDQQAPGFRLFHIQGTATVLIEGLTITGGYSIRGGGIYNENNTGTLTISDCVVTNNTAGPATPAPTGTPSPHGSGGGISTFVPLAGGTPRSGTTAVLRSTISHNTAYSEGHGGGIDNVNSTVTITDSTISDNVGVYGAGIECALGPIRISNSTISNNSPPDGNGIWNGWIVQLTNSTLSNNWVESFGGITELTNTILNNSPISNDSGDIQSHGYNISSDNAHGYLTGPGDQINTDPLLGPLQDNGGPTLTHGLLTGSPAIDAGNPSFTPPPLYDQRGFGYLRVYNERIDIGSFEVQPVGTLSPTPTATATATFTPTPTVAATATATATPTVVPGVTPCADGVTIFAENFDGITAPALPAGWSAVNASGPPPLWVTSTTTPDTPPNAVFIDDPGSVSDKRLETPAIGVPIITAVGYLSFRHLYNLESTFDGAVLEVSTPEVNGGAFTDIADPAVGGGFLSGGYNAVISTSFMSPIAGRMAWSGDSGGYINTVASLGPHLVQPSAMKLRFRMASDNSMSATGWRVDNIVVSGYFCETPTPTPTPFTPSPTPTATIPPPTATPIPTPCGVSFSENFDGVTAPALPAGWRTTHTGDGGGGWGTSPVFPSSGQNDAATFGGFDVGSSQLMSPDIAAPAVGGILSFQNLFNLQEGLDGMVLEISINGGSYTDIIAAGGTFVAGGYTHTISTCCGSPIAGRMAWSGVSAGTTNSPTYITTTLNLPATANGQIIILRWRVANDNFNPVLGLARIDSIVLTPASCPARSLNLSTRMLVQTGASVGIGGFIITPSTSQSALSLSKGSGPNGPSTGPGGGKQVLLRGIGPSLSQFGVPNVLADPVIELHGPAGFTTITNDNWKETQEAEIQATGIPPTNDLESAILATLNPGAYTAIVKGKNDTSGVGLVEMYDLDQVPSSQLANLSTRAFVDAGDNVVIGGFILGGGDHAHIFIHAGSPLGVNPALADATLELRDGSGNLLASNNNCESSIIGPPNPADACIDITLPAGLYTAILAGSSGDTGIGLVEIYNLN